MLHSLNNLAAVLEALVTHSDGPSANSDISLPAVTEVHSTASLDTGNKSELCAEFVEKEQIIEEMTEDLTLSEQRNPTDVMTASTTNLNSFVEQNIGTIDKKNAAQMDLFLKIACFNIPSTIPRVAPNSTFPLRLLTKTLPNGETCTSDWLYWSIDNQSLLSTKVVQISHLLVRNLNGIL